MKSLLLNGVLRATWPASLWSLQRSLLRKQSSLGAGFEVQGVEGPRRCVGSNNRDHHLILEAPISRFICWESNCNFVESGPCGCQAPSVGGCQPSLSIVLCGWKLLVSTVAFQGLPTVTEIHLLYSTRGALGRRPSTHEHLTLTVFQHLLFRDNLPFSCLSGVLGAVSEEPPTSRAFCPAGSAIIMDMRAPWHDIRVTRRSLEVPSPTTPA